MPVVRVGRMVCVAPVEVLRPAIEAHPAIEWEDRMEQMCGKVCTVLEVDDHDDTAEVFFREPLNCSAWFPLSTLADYILCNIGNV